VFPLRYELNLYILFRRYSVYKGLRGFSSTVQVAVFNTLVHFYKKRNHRLLYQHLESFIFCLLRRDWHASKINLRGIYLSLFSPLSLCLREKKGKLYKRNTARFYSYQTWKPSPLQRPTPMARLKVVVVIFSLVNSVTERKWRKGCMMVKQRGLEGVVVNNFHCGNVPGTRSFWNFPVATEFHSHLYRSKDYGARFLSLCFNIKIMYNAKPYTKTGLIAWNLPVSLSDLKYGYQICLSIYSTQKHKYFPLQ
jgi:hypothetical protein